MNIEEIIDLIRDSLANSTIDGNVLKELLLINDLISQANQLNVTISNGRGKVQYDTDKAIEHVSAAKRSIKAAKAIINVATFKSKEVDKPCTCKSSKHDSTD